MASDINFQTIDWSAIASFVHPGETGEAFWQTVQFPGLRIRIVEYSAGYLADHWCSKGHIILCLQGAMTTELQDGRKFELHQGMSYQVGDESESHRSYTERGVKLFIVD